MEIVYTKVEATDEVVVQLAKQCNMKPSEVAAQINQQRYRKSYNRLQQSRMKVVRAVLKQHPELVGEVKG